MTRYLLLFLDGVGLGAADPETNALAVAQLPVCTELMEGARLLERADAWHAQRASLVPLDALLDTPGLPQSGTGQFSLFTGFNGAQRFGRHYGPWVPTALRPLLQRDNLLTRAKADGRRVTFANAYPEELIESAYSGGEFRALGPLRAGPPLTAAGAGVLLRHTPQLQAGDAVSSEITNEGWREHLQRRDLPVITAAQAGQNLARISNEHDLTLFAHYNTDHVGHMQDLPRAIAAIQHVDEFLGGILSAIDPDIVTVVASDHGNLEDTRTGHTRNAALGMVIGPGHAELAERLHSILDVTPALLRRDE